MLSCLLNNQRINCFDGKYSKEQLKKWASKNILICPACGKPYEYCHGKVKFPYFRHKNKKECVDRYVEPETEEHVSGKRDLYEWLKMQPGITDVVLEGWIPGTKQRPDIMFNYNGTSYVIEYQCSPISTEYYERHELYQAAGINDIWILGAEKYLKSNMRKKDIEDNAFAFYSYQDKMLIPIKDNDIYLGMTLNKKVFGYSSKCFYGRILNNFIFDNEIYDSVIGKTQVIKEKRKNRKRSVCNNLLKEGRYLQLQNEKIWNNFNRNLESLSNSNWNFYLCYSHSRFKSFCYICAQPIVDTECYEYYKELNILEDLYSKIKLWRMTDIEYKLCSRDIDFLKQKLLPIMKENKMKLLKYNFENIRVLETNN